MKKGFTLVELLGVIVILAIVGVIAVPTTLNMIRGSKEELSDLTEQVLINSTKSYVNDNENDFPINNGNVYCVSLKKVVRENYLKTPVIDSNTGEEIDLDKIVQVQVTNGNYDISLNDSCVIYINEPFTMSVPSGVVNEYGWAKEDFNVGISGNGLTSYKYCISDKMCKPNTTVEASSGLIPINTEGIHYLCAHGINAEGNTDVQCDIYKLDKTDPVIGSIALSGTEGLNGYYVSDVYVSNTPSTDALSGILTDILSPNAGTVTTDTEGTLYTLTATDKAGNTSSTSYTLKIDKTGPTNGKVEFVGTKGENDWYISDVTVKLNNTDEYTMSSNISSITSDTKGTTVTVKTIDKAGNENPKDYVIKVDKTKPVVGTFNIVGTLGENGWYTSDLTISAIDGSDTISGHVSTTVDITSIKTNTDGTVVTLTTKNGAGLTNTDTVTIMVDKTKPTVGTFDIVGTLGENGWYTSNVTISGTGGSDDISGPVTNTVDKPSITTNTEGTTVTLTTTNKAGLTSTDTTTVKVDKVEPTLTAKNDSVEIVVGTSVDPKTYFNTPSYGKSKQASYSCNVANTSGLAVGTHTITCTAKANNGLSTSASVSVKVNPDTFFAVDNSNANAPVLLTNMIPVVHDGSKWIYSDGTQVNWYNYSTKHWANAVILNSGTTKSKGDTINESDVALWLVWIPRYKYTVFNANDEKVAVQEINVQFESGTATTGNVKCTNALNQTNSSTGLQISEKCGISSPTGSAVVDGSSTYTHPAFCLGTKTNLGACGGVELAGLWVGKFEATGTTSAVTTKPGQTPLSNLTTSSLFSTIQGVKSKYGISNGDSHMIKNMEWGAVAYLKQSKYGLGTTDIGINNYQGSSSPYYKTGCGSAPGTTAVSSTCTSYSTAVGMQASTTGNIYGVFDMSGGIAEATMANGVSTSGIMQTSSSGTFSPATKYFDAYTFTGYGGVSSIGKLGDATKEVGGNNSSFAWYDDYSFYPSNTSGGVQPWYSRGCWMSSGINAGVFCSMSHTGEASVGVGTRVIITKSS